MNIRKATIKDLVNITQVEAECFPQAEAASAESFKARLSAYPDHFWLLESGGKLVSCINGMVTDEERIRDEMFADALLHNESGSWQSIFGVSTIPKCRKKGYAAKLMEQVIKDARAEKRKGCILTCKKELISYYEKFGFVNIGISNSVHGGAVWYDMQLVF